MPRKDRRSLLDACESVQLVLSEVLCERGEPMRFAYFPVGGFVSLVASIDGRAGLEVGMIGREGMLGTHLALGAAVAPLRAQVQGEGSAWRLPAVGLRGELARSDPLRRLLNQYIDLLMADLAVSSGCTRFHRIEPRLARWLLMSHDRAHSDTFHATHEMLALMLGVRRVGVTLAAGALQRSGLIDYRRGLMRVLDRLGLEARACSCYAASRHAYDERIG